MQAIFSATSIDGCFQIDNKFAGDLRGGFCKLFNAEMFAEEKIYPVWKEHYFSVSAKNVIRGMHFQLPPTDHEKLVYVPVGSVLDVVLDLRANSSTFCSSFSCILSAENHKSLFIPKGCAHGFKSLEDNTITSYLVGSLYSKEHDSGVLYNSFGFDWQCDEPILSERDKTFCTLKEFCKRGILWS